MPLEIKDKLDQEKIGTKALSFNNYIDNYFGLIILVLVLLVFIFSFSLVWYPRLSQAINSINAIKLQLDDERFQLMRYQTAINKYQEAYQGISQDNRIKINNIIAPAGQYSTIYNMDLMISLQKLLQENNFIVYDITVSGEEEKTDVNKNKRRVVKKKSSNSDDDSLPADIVPITIDFTVESIDYNNLKRLLHLLEEKLRIMDVENIDFSPSDGTCNLKLLTYRFTNG